MKRRNIEISDVRIIPEPLYFIKCMTPFCENKIRRWDPKDVVSEAIRMGWQYDEEKHLRLCPECSLYPDIFAEWDSRIKGNWNQEENQDEKKRDNTL